MTVALLRRLVLANALVATFGPFFSATVKEAVADVEITKEENTAKTGARTARPRAVKSRRPKQPDVSERATNL